MTPAFLFTSLFVSTLQRLACWLLDHDFGAFSWWHRRFAEAHRSMECRARCLRCGVPCCVEAFR